MKNLLLLAAIVFISTNASATEQVETADLDAFAKKVIEVFASGEESQYMSILHPNCPTPNPARLNWQLSKKWQADKAQYSIANLAKAYDREQLTFVVEPEYALNFQVWTIGKGEEIELVTGYPVASHEGELKIIDYPCFEPK